MVAIIDYDAGNTLNVQKACEALGMEAVLTKDADAILKAERAILPGVGAFGSAMERLQAYGLVPAIREFVRSGRPFLGICLGLQLLFEESEESPGVPGLALLEGKILKFPEKEGLRVPHMGWNSLTFPKKSRLFSAVEEHSYVYFVHSYYLRAKDPEVVAAQSEYGLSFDAAVEAGNVFGVQFHPEKSGEVGLSILREFLRL